MSENDLLKPTTLEQAIVQRDDWYDTALQHHRNEQYYRSLVVQIGKMLGPEAYVSDDGSVQDSVLCAKVPELVAQRLNPAMTADDARSAMPRLDESGQPLNVLNALYGHATAVNNYVAAKEQYDENVAPPPADEPPEDVPEPPDIDPISPGGRIVPDQAKYIVDRSGGSAKRKPIL